MATKNIVPRADGEGSLGTEAKKWGAVYANDIVLADNETLAAKLQEQDETLAAKLQEQDETLAAKLQEQDETLAAKLQEQDETLAAKLDKNLGAENANKALMTDELGNVIVGDGGGHLIVPAIPSPAEAKGKVVYFVYDAVSKTMKGYIKNGDAMVEIGKNDGVPVGTVSWWFGSKETIPQGWIALDDAEYTVDGICKALYPIYGNKYGGVEGSTFRVPNLMGKYIKADENAGTELEAGLPNITGSAKIRQGAFASEGTGATRVLDDTLKSTNVNTTGSLDMRILDFDASRSSSIYGNSDTVQPPSLTAIPIVKAFSADVEEIEPTSEQELRADVALQASGLAGLAGRTDVIAQGDGYIRYANGLQMCWGAETKSVTMKAWGNVYEAQFSWVAFSMPFLITPIVTVSPSVGNGLWFEQISANTIGFEGWAVSALSSTKSIKIQYIAIGKWK